MLLRLVTLIDAIPCRRLQFHRSFLAQHDLDLTTSLTSTHTSHHLPYFILEIPIYGPESSVQMLGLNMVMDIRGRRMLPLLVLCSTGFMPFPPLNTLTTFDSRFMILCSVEHLLHSLDTYINNIHSSIHCFFSLSFS